MVCYKRSKRGSKVVLISCRALKRGGEVCSSVSTVYWGVGGRGDTCWITCVVHAAGQGVGKHVRL